MSFLKSFFKAKEPAERRSAPRRNAPGCEMGHLCGDGVRAHSIRDISATGVYLQTSDRWLPGSMVPLTLQQVSEFQAEPRQSITLPGNAVRCDEDGQGFSFILPEGLDVASWVDLIESSRNEEAPGDVPGQFRMAEAIAFLARIAPSTLTGLRHLIRGELNNQHVGNAIEIALRTKEIVSSWDGAGALRAHEHIVLHILEHGSWADEDAVQRLWAGLLAASCMPEPADESNLFLVDLFSGLATIHIRIFTAACQRARVKLGGDGEVAAEPLEFSQEEITKISHSRDLVRIERDLFHLSELGLIERNEKSKSMAVIDSAHVTPTNLGMELYARCNAHRGAVAEFYGAAQPAAQAV